MKRNQRSKRKADTPPPDLRFGPGELAGFTSSSVAGFQSLNPAAVVRELLQNSLDAAREANREVAQVRFEVEEHRRTEVPGIEAYKRAFRHAVRDQKKEQHGRLPSQAEMVTRTIAEQLKERRCRSLFVIDNGIGLDDGRMRGVLADGLSVKGESGAGAFGYGHFVVMPASNLRYVLYGGRTDRGRVIGSGHAILASHNGDAGRTRAEPCGKDGYFVSGFSDRLFDRFEFARGDAVPPYLRDKLDWIARTWPPGAGAVVAVPGFNDFRNQGTEWWQSIVKAAACNFFPAIHAGELSVETVDRDEVWKLDAHNVKSILERFRTEKRSKFLSGSRACSAFETITRGKALEVRTDAGIIPIRLRQAPEDGISRIELCRNGMWITDEVPRLNRHQFARLKPFHCVLLLDATAGKQIHGLVRKAEGPLHNHLEARNLLTPDERRTLEAAMEQVSKAISEHVPEDDTDVTRIDDVLTVNTHGIESGERRPAVIGRFKPLSPRPRLDGLDETDPDSDPWDHSDEGRRQWRSKRARPAGRPILLRALAVPTAARSCRVELRSDEGCRDSEIRFALDESVDESCERPGGDTWVRITRVRLDGQPVPESALTGRGDDGAVGVMLGALTTGVTRKIEFDFALPDDMQLQDGIPVVLKAQIFRRVRPAARDAQPSAVAPPEAEEANSRA